MPPHKLESNIGRSCSQRLNCMNFATPGRPYGRCVRKSTADLQEHDNNNINGYLLSSLRPILSVAPQAVRPLASVFLPPLLTASFSLIVQDIASLLLLDVCLCPYQRDLAQFGKLYWAKQEQYEPLLHFNQSTDSTSGSFLHHCILLFTSLPSS